MTKCDAALLARYLDRELPLSDRLKVEGHLAGCDSCRRELQTLRKLDRVLRDWGARRTPIPVDTERRVLVSVMRKQRSIQPILAFGRVMPAAVGTTFAALLVLASVNLGPYLGSSVASKQAVAPSRSALEKVSAPLVKARRVSAMLGVRSPQTADYLQRHRLSIQ